MKKFLLTISVSIFLVLQSFADEGMWLPMLLGQQVYKDMVAKGLKLTAEQLYSVNKASLKDAVIIFGTGCTGEIVSAEGLIFTNHHCGYPSIASASTIENNYLRDGFYARSKAEEIKTNLTVQFLLRIDDVTAEVMDSLKGLNGVDRLNKQSSVLASINTQMSDPANSIETRISPIFKGNQFLAFVYQRYSDIRLVGTPPESIGKFGGDTDNWEWPRHTGDFSVFRVYANGQNKPSEYASTNVPFKPKWFLPVSIKPLRENDFAMVWGYPGSTNRYESSYGIRLAVDINNPSLVKLRDVRLKYMLEEIKKDPAVKLQLATSYAAIANYWKFYEGETKQLLKYDIYGQKKKAEEKFILWSAGKPEYDKLFTEWGTAYTTWTKYAKERVYLNEGILGSPLIAFAASLAPVENALVGRGGAAGNLKTGLEAASQARTLFIKSENRISDQKILAAVTRLFYTDIPADQHPIGFFSGIKNKYGPLDDEATYKKLAADIFDNSFLLDNTKWNAFVSHPDANQLQNDPAFSFASAFLTNYNSKYLPYFMDFTAKNLEYGRIYLKGIMEMDPVKAKMMYPDATFTMRVSYGVVKPYKPSDAVTYDFITTSKGLLEKYKPGDYEFNLPEKQIELLKKKDFGIYADPVRKDLVIAFISTTDITGGNSGSPVLNGKGELIGLAFDGNYEALSHKLAYDKDLNRTINVDIRYVLWCIDVLGGAKNIIAELKLVK
ncbi:MAG: S46 family peptidase [Chitinophagaceae bacterium]